MRSSASTPPMLSLTSPRLGCSRVAQRSAASSKTGSAHTMRLRRRPRRGVIWTTAWPWSVYVQRGRLRGSTRSVHARVGLVNAWVEGLVQRTTVYEDIDEARASAERLAEERG